MTFDNLLFLALVCVFGHGLWVIWKRTSAKKWRATEGQIINCDLASSFWSRGWRKLCLEYMYSVDGVEYTGKNKTPGGQDIDWRINGIIDSFQSDLEKYPINSRPMVYFDPKNPRDSALERPSILNIVAVNSLSFLVILAIAAGGK